MEIAEIALGGVLGMWALKELYDHWKDEKKQAKEATQKLENSLADETKKLTLEIHTLALGFEAVKIQLGYVQKSVEPISKMQQDLTALHQVVKQLAPDLYGKRIER